MLKFDLLATDPDSHARRGTLTLNHGVVQTPIFMPVGTYGTVKGVMPRSLEDMGAQIILGNTFHLWMRPGLDVMQSFGGLHQFEKWNKPILTDSGGFQVWSLGAMRKNDGVDFRSTYDGSLHRFTPEIAVDVQERIGADIQMVLDVCPPLPSPPVALRVAVERTAAWAARARASHRRADQSLFGIVQGGTDPALRIESAERTVELGFDGYGIGGLSVGESREEMIPALAAAVSRLPADRPRYLMGVGDPASLVEAIGVGIDQFDCVLQTRLGRHGTALTSHGRVNLSRAAHAGSDAPIDESCPCEVCARHSRGFLRHLLQVGEPTASRLVSIHNVAWTLDFMDRARRAIVGGTFDDFRRGVLATWA